MGAHFVSFLDEFAGMVKLLRRQVARPADLLAAALRGRHARFRALGDQLALELGERRDDVEIEPTAGADRVDLLLRRPEPDPGFAQAIDHLDLVGQGSPKTISFHTTSTSPLTRIMHERHRPAAQADGRVAPFGRGRPPGATRCATRSGLIGLAGRLLWGTAPHALSGWRARARR